MIWNGLLLMLFQRNPHMLCYFYLPSPDFTVFLQMLSPKQLATDLKLLVWFFMMHHKVHEVHVYLISSLLLLSTSLLSAFTVFNLLGNLILKEQLP